MVQQMAGALKEMAVGQFSVEEPSNKKRKLEADHVGSVPVVAGSMPVLPLGQALAGCDDAVHPEVSLLDPLVSDEDLLVEDFPLEYMPPSESVKRSQSADLVESMFDFVKEDNGAVPLAGNIDSVAFQ